MGANPGDTTQKQDDERRNRPNNQLDPPGILPVGTIRGPPVARAKPPGKRQCQDDDRNDDGQHNCSCVAENKALCLANWTVGIEHPFTA